MHVNKIVSGKLVQEVMATMYVVRSPGTVWPFERRINRKMQKNPRIF